MECYGRSSSRGKLGQMLCGKDYQKEEGGRCSVLFLETHMQLIPSFCYCLLVRVFMFLENLGYTEYNDTPHLSTASQNLIRKVQ